MFLIFKRFLTDDATFYTFIILLVAVISFGLGQRSVMEDSAPHVAQTITTQPVKGKNSATSVSSTTAMSAEQLVASKNGSKYHYLWCPGASQMKEENKIFFDSVEAAKAAGYEPAANCAGLE